MKKTFLLDLAFLTLLFGALGCDFAREAQAFDRQYTADGRSMRSERH